MRAFASPPATLTCSLTDLGALAEPIRIIEGYFTPPDRPGHGIIFDRPVLVAQCPAAPLLSDILSGELYPKTVPGLGNADESLRFTQHF
jgi:hypothetical protein